MQTDLVAIQSKRTEKFKRLIQKLSSDRIEILYVIGGDGSLRAAHAISKLSDETGDKISVVGIPKTTDNDILWVWQSFGFLSAVERAKRANFEPSYGSKLQPTSFCHSIVWLRFAAILSSAYAVHI